MLVRPDLCLPDKNSCHIVQRRSRTVITTGKRTREEDIVRLCAEGGMFIATQTILKHHTTRTHHAATPRHATQRNATQHCTAQHKFSGRCTPAVMLLCQLCRILAQHVMAERAGVLRARQNCSGNRSAIHQNGVEPDSRGLGGDSDWICKRCGAGRSKLYNTCRKYFAKRDGTEEVAPIRGPTRRRSISVEWPEAAADWMDPPKARSSDERPPN